MKTIITILIAAIVALFPIYMFQIHYSLGVIFDIVFLVGAIALQDPSIKAKDTEIVLSGVLFSILCQIAWALVA